MENLELDAWDCAEECKDRFQFCEVGWLWICSSSTWVASTNSYLPPTVSF